MDEYNECKLTEAFRTIGILVNEYRDTVDDISDEILENLRKAIAYFIILPIQNPLH